MASIISWFGSSESVMRSKVEPGAAVKPVRRKNKEDHPQRRDHSKHHNHRRKEESMEKIVYVDECPDGYRDRRKPSAASFQSGPSKPHDATKSNRTKDERGTDEAGKSRPREANVTNTRGRGARQLRKEKRSISDEIRRSSEKRAAVSSTTVHQPSQPIRPSLYRSKTTTTHERRRSSNDPPPLSYNAAKVGQATSTRENERPVKRRESTTIRERPSIQQGQRRHSDVSTTKPPKLSDRRASASNIEHTSSTRRPDPPRHRSSISSVLYPSRSKQSSTPHAPKRSVSDIHTSKAKASSTLQTSKQKPSSPTYASRPKPKPKIEKTLECLTCCDALPASKIQTLACSHNWCNTCLRHIFQSSITDPTQMPPKCCSVDHPIEPKHVAKLFDPPFKKKWNRKYAEYHTKNRVYCPNKKCAEWIKPKHYTLDTLTGRKYAKCPRCKTKACVTCSGKFHPSTRECPKDANLQAFIELSKDSGWQRCYACKAMVELQAGCNHMTCRCGAQFCMACGSQWRTCECQWFNDEQVALDAEEQRRDPFAGPHVHGQRLWDRDALGGGWGRPRADRFGGGGGGGGLNEPFQRGNPFAEYERQRDERFARQQRRREQGEPFVFGRHPFGDAPFFEQLRQQRQPAHQNRPNTDNDEAIAREAAAMEAAFDAFDFGDNAEAGNWHNDFVTRARDLLGRRVDAEQGRAADEMVEEIRERARMREGREEGTYRRERGGERGDARVNVMDFLDDEGEAPPDEDAGEARRRASLLAGIQRGQRGGERVNEWRMHVNG